MREGGAPYHCCIGRSPAAEQAFFGVVYGVPAYLVVKWDFVPNVLKFGTDLVRAHNMYTS